MQRDYRNERIRRKIEMVGVFAPLVIYGAFLLFSLLRT
jgi:hypothetical protein